VGTAPEADWSDTPDPKLMRFSACVACFRIVMALGWRPGWMAAGERRQGVVANSEEPAAA